MSREITSKKAPEKFSFICNLTVSHDVEQKVENTETITVQAKQSKSSTKEIEDWIREVKNSSALVKRTSNSLVPSEPATISNQWYELDLNFDVFQPNLLNASDIDYNSSSNRNSGYLGKIFFAAACTYLVFALWWLMGHKNGQLSNVFAFMNGHQETISQADAEFLDYMEKSLEIIDRKLLSQKEETSTISKKDDPANIVYVPVYTANSKAQPKSLNPIPLPPPPPPPTVTFDTPVAKITPPPPPKLQTENPVTIPPVSESTETLPEPPPVEVSAAVKPTKSYTLVGLVELGANPTAMFRGKGGTKRITIGQKIDDSGWKLKAIEERTVVVTRQGQSRTINVGEKL